MKKSIAIFSLLLLTACTAQPEPETQDDAEDTNNAGMEMQEKEEMNEIEHMDTMDKEEMLEESDETDEEGRTIMLKASNWEFAPNTITVQKGEKVSLNLMGVEGNHGIAIPGLDVNVSMAEGEISLVELPTDTAGTYEFFCNVPCGPGHREMKGTIVIEE